MLLSFICQTYYYFKLDFQKVHQHTWGKWLIHGTKRRKDNQLQSLKLIRQLPTDRQKLVVCFTDLLAAQVQLRALC